MHSLEIFMGQAPLQRIIYSFLISLEQNECRKCVKIEVFCLFVLMPNLSSRTSTGWLRMGPAFVTHAETRLSRRLPLTVSGKLLNTFKNS